MKILLLVFLTFVLCCCSGKKNSQTDGSSLQTSVLCDTIGGKVVFPNDIDSGCCMMFTRHKKVYLYNKPNGMRIDTLINDMVNENYLVLSLRGFDGDYAFVEASYALDSLDLFPKKEHIGWIEKKYLMTYLNCSDYECCKYVYLYKQPTEKSEKVDSVEHPWWGVPYFVHGCKNGWLLIENNGRKGWVSPEEQCCNPYTTCC